MDSDNTTKEQRIDFENYLKSKYLTQEQYSKIDKKYVPDIGTTFINTDNIYTIIKETIK